MDRTSRDPVKPEHLWTYVLMIAITALAITGCQSSVERTDILGSWECSRGPRFSCIDVLNDGTYRQLITANGTQELSTTSTWSWEQVAGHGMGISFKTFHSLRDDGSAISTPPGWWFVVPERGMYAKTPKLVVFEDEGIAFIKRNSPCPGPTQN
jgi:hypothetical protein